MTRALHAARFEPGLGRHRFVPDYDGVPELDGYDSTRPDLIPANAAVVFPYGDGDYRWSSSALARFRGRRMRSITVLGNPRCNIGDVENGDMRPQDAPAFLEDHGAERGTIYCNRDSVEEVQFYVGQAGIGDAAWFLFLATLDGTLVTPAEHSGGGILVACQAWQDPAKRWDRSRIWRRSWPVPVP